MKNNKNFDYVLDLTGKICNAFTNREMSPRRDEIWQDVVNELECLLNDEQKKKLDKLCFFFSLSMAGEILSAIQFTLEYINEIKE